MDPALVMFAIKEAPAAIAAFRALFGKAHPNEPVPDDAQVLEAFNEAHRRTIATDDKWLADHPEKQP